MVVKSKSWVLGVLIATGLASLLGALSRQGKEIGVHTDPYLQLFCVHGLYLYES